MLKPLLPCLSDETSEWLPGAGAQVTLISAGTGHNVVPDLCTFIVDVRSNDRYGNERMLEMISSVCQAEIVPRSTRLKPSILPDDHLLMKAIRDIDIDTFWIFHPVGYGFDTFSCI